MLGQSSPRTTDGWQPYFEPTDAEPRLERPLCSLSDAASPPEGLHVFSPLGLAVDGSGRPASEREPDRP